MDTILLVILIVIALALIGVVLVQRSEGGALGIGGGPGGLFSARGSANLLTRITAGLAAAFMILSLVLVILEGSRGRTRSVMDVSQPEATTSGEVEAPIDDDGSADYTPPADGAGETSDAAPAPAPESGAAAPPPSEPSVPQSQ